MPKLARISLLIWLAGLAVRLTLVSGLHRYELFRPEPVKIAISLAKAGTFADPYAIPTGLTAHAAPLYPMLLAPLYYFFGDTPTADFARIILSIAAASASYALLPLVARSLGIWMPVGILAGFTGALLPAHYWPESMGEFETAFVPLFLELSIIFFSRLIRSAELTMLSAAWAGLWSGLGALLSPSVVPVLAGLGALAFWKLGGRVWRWAVVAGIVALAGITPWLTRDAICIGGLFFIRDNFGLELYVSNHDDALAEIERNDMSPFYSREHPFASADIARQLSKQGERQFEKDRLQRALEWIHVNPLKFAGLTGARVRNFWFGAMLPPLPRFLLWGLSIAAFAGWIVLYRQDRWPAIVLGSILLTYPMVYYLIQNGMRYEHAIYWIKLLLAANLAVQIANTSRQRLNLALNRSPDRKAST